MHYLWLILPFWQTMKGAASQNVEKSTYLWSKELVYPLNKEVQKCDVWNTLKISSILNSMTKATMGVEMNISSWRHIAIAISQRFLKQAFTDPTDEENDESINEIGNISRNLDSVFDLQAAHSVNTAYRVYATEIKQAIRVRVRVTRP